MPRPRTRGPSGGAAKKFPQRGLYFEEIAISANRPFKSK